jgi:Zn-dependent M28 family amino/carboxypeptidase
VVAAGRAQGRYFTPDPHPETGGFYRSDHFSFAKQGVPAISFSQGLDLVNGGTARGEALSQEYNTKHYHQPSDEWHADWDWSGVAENAELLHQVGLRLVNSREWPNWSADSEFRAARDATAAERTGAAPAPAPQRGERGE